LGFDLGPTPEKTINNLYAGTEFYKPQGSTPTFAGNWIRQLRQIMQEHRQVRFTRVYGPTTAHVPQFDDVSNMHRLDLSVFLDRINNKKDL
jgi:hypothetical protein